MCRRGRPRSVRYRAVSRYYITTPIYYVKDAPHVGHAYTTVNADALARWHRLIGDEVFFLTGTDEHGQKVARAAEEQGLTPGEWTDQLAPRFAAGVGGARTSPTTTSSAPPSRATVWLSSSSSAASTTTASSTRTPTAVSTASPASSTTPRTSWSTARCVPIHRTPVEHLEEENYFFRLSAFEQRLIEWYEANPTAVVPESKRNEALSFIKGGLRDISITRTSIDWGVRVPWDEEHVFYVWYDALVNYLTAIGYGEDEERFEQWWPAVHHLIGKEIIRFHCVWWPAMCMAAGIDPPAHVQVHGWLLLGGEKMSNSSVNQIAPADLIAEYGVDPVRYHLLRDIPLGSDGDFSAEGIAARYNADLANNLGNLLSRVATVVGSKCGGIGSGPRTRQPPGRSGRRGRGRGHRGLGRRPAPPGPRGHLAAHPRDQRRAGDGRAVEGRAGPGGGRRARERPRGAAHRLAPHRAGHADHRRGDLARGSGSPGSPADQRLPAAADLGRVPGGPAGGEGRTRSSPGARADRGRGWTTPSSSGSTPTATCRTSSPSRTKGPDRRHRSPRHPLAGHDGPGRRRPG